MVDRAVHKVPWSTTVIYDGDGSNHAIAEAMAKLGISTMHSIPGRQSLNPAESLVGINSRAAQKSLLHAKLSPEYFGYAMEHAASHHNFIACSTRGNKNPHEIVTGQKPDISHCRKFGHFCFAQKSLAKRTDGERNKSTPSEWTSKAGFCIFLGYMNGTSKTYKLKTVRGKRAIIHTKDVQWMNDNRDPREINPVTFEHNLVNTRIWADKEDSSKSV
jgi:hypothetical protein